MIQKFKNIIKGFTNFLKAKADVADEEVEELAKLRYSQCMRCPEKKGENCGACGCVLGAKVRVLEESCPLNKW